MEPIIPLDTIPGLTVDATPFAGTFKLHDNLISPPKQIAVMAC
jgi:hypothetical protein